MLKFLMFVTMFVTMFGNSGSNNEWKPEVVQKNLEDIEIVTQYVEESKGLHDVEVEKDDDGYLYIGYNSEERKIAGEYLGSIQYAKEYVYNSKTNIY